MVTASGMLKVDSFFSSAVLQVAAYASVISPDIYIEPISAVFGKCNRTYSCTPVVLYKELYKLTKNAHQIT